MASDPYFVAEGTNGNSVELNEDPLRPGELLLTADGGTRVRVRLDEHTAVELADAVHRWYDTSYVTAHSFGGRIAVVSDNPGGATATDEEVAEDVVTQYRDGMVYSFNSPPEG